MSKKTLKATPLEGGLLSAMKALDNQVAREMQRTPAQRSEQGVRKWEPYEKGVEIIVTFILTQLGEENITLDSLNILMQAFAKAGYILAEDLGTQGL